MTSRVDKGWDFFGRSDPYFAVLTNNRYHLANLTEERKRQFFESGTRHIAEVLESIRTYVDPSFDPNRGLDFGCGVGRLTIPMAAFCGSVVGADVSESMLEVAKENCRSDGIPNIEFKISDDWLSKIPGKFDFIHSFLVFQHIPRNRGVEIFARLLDKLEEGGIGAIHFTYHRSASLPHRFIYWVRKSFPPGNSLVNLLLRRPINQPMLEMNEYRMNDLFRVLQLKGCVLARAELSRQSIPYETVSDAILFCRKEESKNWPTGAE